MSDFSLVVGTHKTIVPKAMAPDGSPIGFPEGSVFAWTSSDANIEISDPSAASPEIVAIGPAVGVTITGTVQEEGFTHTKSHTIDSVAAPVDTIGDFDFDIV